ncbi:MAG: DUF4270 family protein [Alistipes sp.]|nr:DUF4270 family protein [Alistipes sp.]
MRNFANRICAILLLAIATIFAISLTACTPEIDSSLGGEIMPENQTMVLRHLKLHGNKITQYNHLTEENEEFIAASPLIESRQFRTDSVISSNLDYGYFGVRFSDTLGMRSAGFASSIIYMNELDEKLGWGYKPIFDTMKLLLSINKYKGDTLVPVKYYVYELKKGLAGNVLDEEDSIAYINCDLSDMYDESKPLFSFTFPVAERGEGPGTTTVLLDPVTDNNGKMSAQTWDYIRRLMLIPENYNAADSDWDGYGRDGLEYYQDEAKWVEKFHGVYIKPDLSSISGSQGAMYATKLDASGLMLKGRNRNPLDPTLIQDTIGMYYYFYDEYTKYNLSVNSIKRDYSRGLTQTPVLNSVVMDEKKSIEERTQVGMCHIEGIGGSVAELTFTDEMLDQLRSLLLNESGKFSKMGINQCLMTLYLDKASYDWSVTQGNYVELTPLLDKAFDRVGTYLYYHTLSPIVDYDYVNEEKYSTELTYGGYIDRSRGCYILNITGYIQRLFRYINETARQEDGSYKFDRNDPNYAPRTIYIGAKATDLFDFSTVSIQGMDDGTNKAPIQIDLTYTLIK